MADAGQVVAPRKSALALPDMFAPIPPTEDSRREKALQKFVSSVMRSRHPDSPSPEPASQSSSCSSYPSAPSPALESPALRRRKNAQQGKSTSPGTPTPPTTGAVTPVVGGSKWSWARLSLRTVQAFRSAGKNRRRRETEASLDSNDPDACTHDTPFLSRSRTSHSDSEDFTHNQDAPNERPSLFRQAVQQIMHQVRVVSAFRNTVLRRILPATRTRRFDALTPRPPPLRPVRVWRATIQRIMFQIRVVRAFRDGMVRRMLAPSPRPASARALWLHALRLVVFQLRVARAFQHALVGEPRRRSSSPPSQVAVWSGANDEGEGEGEDDADDADEDY